MASTSWNRISQSRPSVALKVFMRRQYDSSAALRALYRPFIPLFHREAMQVLLRRSVWRVLNRVQERRLTTETKHGRFSFSSKDAVIGRNLFIFGDYGYADVLRAVEVLKDNGKLEESTTSYLVDIGANIGTVCIPLVKSGVFKGALAFEPDPRNFSYLCDNVRQNGLSARITARQIALSAADGAMDLEQSSSNFGDHRIRLTDTSTPDQFAEQTREVVTVRVQPLANALEDLGMSAARLALLWIDVQGHEWHVLQGAESIMMQGVPIVLEVWPYGLHRAQTDFAAFGAMLARHYSCFFDLRDNHPQKQPITEFRGLLDRLSDIGPEATTDILVLNA